jgi:predicted nucleic acid-binding protein
MPTLPLLRVVLDTNVVFEGLTYGGGAAGLIVEAWLADHLFQAYLSEALAYEYIDVLYRKLDPNRLKQIQPVLDKLISLAHFTQIYYSWRPTSPDPGDDFLVDCAMNAMAVIVTSNLKDLKIAEKSLGLRILNSSQFIRELTLNKHE